MRIACINFPHFAVQVERVHTPSIGNSPVVIGGYPYEKKRVYEVSEEAMAKSVRIGMPLREAYGLCPKAVFLPIREENYFSQFEAILTILYSFSPVLEWAYLGCAFVGLEPHADEIGLGRKITSLIREKTRFDSSAGFASSKFVAWAACQMIGPGEVVRVPDRQEEKFLKDLPLDLLPVSEETLRRFKLLGLTTLGQVANLPLKKMDREFGHQSKLLWELAKGIDRSRLKRWKPQYFVEGSHFFETLAETSQQMIEEADRLLAGLISKLDKRKQKSGKLIVNLVFADKSIVTKVLPFKDPVFSKEKILERFTHWLEGDKFDGPVVEMKLSLDDLCPREGMQMGLYREFRVRARLNPALKSLRARFGKNVIKRAVLSESSARLPEESFRFVEFG